MQKGNNLIGARIEFTEAYNIQLKHRVKVAEDLTAKIKSLELKQKTGWIVGLRSAMMTEIKYEAPKFSSSIFEEPDQYESAYVTGKQEVCYLVTQRAFGRHILVRKCDTLATYKG